MKHCNVCPYPSKCTARVKCRLGKNVVEEVEIEIEIPKPVLVKEKKRATKSTKTVKKPKKTKKK